MSALQDTLGQLNDAAVARKALRELAAQQPAQALGSGFVIGLLTEREPHALEKMSTLEGIAARATARLMDTRACCDRLPQAGRRSAVAAMQ